MASGAPGGNFRTWTPTPPERGSFPLDHYGECTDQMTKYLECMRFTENRNAPNCRLLAKEYLRCRMDHQLMEKSEWDSLGLVNLPGDKTIQHTKLLERKVNQPFAPKENQNDDTK